jgi:hypothetical protein
MISHRRSRHSPRNRVVSSNNKKQALLPTTAEILDNPIGTACGFALDIAKAGFFLIPRLLARGGSPSVIQLKRFHTYGLGESHVDQLFDRGRGPRPRRQRQARLSHPLPADRDQAFGNGASEHRNVVTQMLPLISAMRVNSHRYSPQRIFGGQLRGNWDHQYLVLPNGQRLDLTEPSQNLTDIQAAGRDPYQHDRRFWNNRDHRESMASCEATREQVGRRVPVDFGYQRSRPSGFFYRTRSLGCCRTRVSLSSCSFTT